MLLKLYKRHIRNKWKEKLLSSVSMYLNALETVKGEYGDQALEKIYQAHLSRVFCLNKERARKFNGHSPKVFCAAMEKGIFISHDWQKLEDKENVQAYRFTYCLWADVFRQLGAPKIGLWICQGDESAIRAFNPNIVFKRTKTLMEGHDCCNHVYYLDGEK